MLTKESSKFEIAREKFRREFFSGICPVDGRQPIPNDLAKEMVQELIDCELSKDAVIGVIDSFLILSTHLKEAGFVNLILLENEHQDLTELQQKYYNNVRTLCEKSGINYYIPPMNNYSRCNMKFDVIIGNPPYSDTTSSSTNNGNLDSKFFSIATERSDIVKMIIRSKHFCNDSSSFRKQLFSSGNIKKIHFLPEDTFNTVTVRTCIVTYDTNHSGLTSLHLLDKTVKEVFLSPNDIVHPTHGVLSSPQHNLGARWKRGKLNLNKIVESPEGVTFVKALGRKDEETHTCIIDIKLESCGYKKYGVLVPNMGTSNGSIGKVVIKPYEAVAGHSIVQLWTDTEEEAYQLAEYLQTDEIKSLIKDIKFSNPNPKSLFSLIPDPLK